jgi:hypothetical protein
MLEDVSSFDPTANFNVSQTGTLICISSTGELPGLIFWLDSAGNIEPLHLPPGFYWTPRVSPDGNRLAFGMGPDGEGARRRLAG